MKVKEAIKRADLLRPNALGDEQKAAWLHDLDGQLAEFFGRYWLTESKPSDWQTNWTDYYVNKGTERKPIYAKVTGTTAPEWESGKYYKYKTAPENQFPQVDVELLTPPPYDEIYVLWLACKIDYYHQEMDLYANDSAIYEQALAEMRAWWRRGHVPACSTKWEGL